MSDTSKKYLMTKEEYERLKEELNYLKKVRRKEIIEAIATARAHGDLSENAEYDAEKRNRVWLKQKYPTWKGNFLKLKSLILRQ